MKKIMSNLKHQIQEASRIEEILEKSLKEKQLTCERMEAELVHLRKELDAKFIQTRYENSSKILDKIITSQRDPSNKNGIGYSQEENQIRSKYYVTALLSTFMMKEELVNVLDGLRRYRNKYRHLKGFFVEQHEEHEQQEKETKKIMSNLKHQIQEANRIEEILEKSLK